MEGVEKREEQTSKKRPHVLVIPHYSRGHIIPALLLSKELVRQGIRVTFVNHKPEIDRLLSDEGSALNGIDLLEFVGLPRPNVVTVSPAESAALLAESFKAANMIEQFSHSEGPTCLVSDTFHSWSADLALELQIPRYTFLPNAAVAARFLQVMEDAFDKGILRKNPHGSELERFGGQIKVPGVPALRYHELIIHCRLHPIFFKNTAKSLMAASGILMNTFYELEAPVIDILRNLSPIKGQKFYAVGPLIQPSNSVAVIQDSKEECMRWLDSQPVSSVLYVCFGTLSGLKPLQIKEVALGLEHSKHRFLWVLPRSKFSAPSDTSALDPEPVTADVVQGSNVLPLGFEARVAGRGYIEKSWAPQVQVLSHPSTAGFLTHCGWNSCLEAVSRGVTMLAWPLLAEQHLNCRYLVDELKVASEFQKRADRIVEHEEVDRAVRVFMEEERIAMRARMTALKLKATAALAAGGSSACARQQLAEDIKNL